MVFDSMALGGLLLQAFCIASRQVSRDYEVPLFRNIYLQYFVRLWR